MITAHRFPADDPATPAPRYSAFEGLTKLASGPPAEVAVAVAAAERRGSAAPLLVFDDRTGEQIDLDLRGTDDEIRARHSPASPSAGEPAAPAPRGRGRPRLGVVAREVTLLPRHWEWLAAQSGGASVVLRRLVDEARRAETDRGRLRRQRERAYRFLAAIAGNLPGFEEANRALFAGDRPGFESRIAAWPEDVRRHALLLADEDTP